MARSTYGESKVPIIRPTRGSRKLVTACVDAHFFATEAELCALVCAQELAEKCRSGDDILDDCPVYVGQCERTTRNGVPTSTAPLLTGLAAST